LEIKRLESIYDAVRKVRELLPHEDQVWLMTYDNERFFVTTYETDLEKQIAKDFYNGGYDGYNPEEYAKLYTVWEYAPAENKDRYKYSYANFKATPLSKEFIRGKKDVEGETIASFSIQ